MLYRFYFRVLLFACLMLGTIAGIVLLAQESQPASGWKTAPIQVSYSSQGKEQSNHASHANHTATGFMVTANNGPALETLPQGHPGTDRFLIDRTSEQGRANDIGAFRTVCKPSHFNYDDSILYSRQPNASHLHLYFGNSIADAHSSYESLRASGNSTCRGGIANRSAYWVPALMDQDQNVLLPDMIHVYYKSGYSGVKPQEIQPFPHGLKLIAGDSSRTEASDAIPGYFECNEYPNRSPGLPQNCASGSTLRIAIDFPQCWDGKNLDSEDHKRHMAYAEAGCPASHPVPLTQVSYILEYKVSAPTTQGWRLSSDNYDTRLKPGGYSLHADWIEAWDPDIEQTWIEQCVRASRDCASHLIGDGRALGTYGF